MLFLTTVLISCIFVWIVTKWLKVKNYWAKLNVPYLSPHPILGSLTFLQQQNTSLWLRQMYDRFKVPYFGIWLFWRPALVVNSPELTRNILIKESAVFRDRFISSGDTDPLGALNLFTVNDPIWTNIRKKITSVFTASKLKTLQGFYHSKGRELMQRIEKERNNRIDLRITYADYTTDIIGTFAFGVDGNATTTGEGPLRNVTKELMQFNIFRGLSWCSIFFFPELVNIFRFKFFPRSTMDYFRRIFKKIVAQRETSDIRVGDFLDTLVKLQKEDTNKEFSEDFFISQAAAVLVGGFDTTATALTFITYELAYNPDIQEKLYQELLEAKKLSGEEQLSYETLSEAVYLNCIIKEALRKYPVMGWVDRIASSDYKVDDNLTIKAGTPVYINIMGMHHDPKYFDNPDNFDPDRFLPENEKNMVPYTYLPFGEGPRICIGQRFALINIRYVMSSLILNYELRKYEDSIHVSDIKMDKRAIFFLPAEPLNVQFIPRMKQ